MIPQYYLHLSFLFDYDIYLTRMDTQNLQMQRTKFILLFSPFFILIYFLQSNGYSPDTQRT